MAFALDQRLKHDTFIIGSNDLNLLLMMNDSRYPWFIVVPQVDQVSEWFDLPLAQQQQLHQDCVQVGACVKSAFACDKINIAALGNVVQQMHVHIIGRTRQDAAWPGPVWGHSPATHYTEEQKRQRILQVLEQKDLPFAAI